MSSGYIFNELRLGGYTAYEQKLSCYTARDLKWGCFTTYDLMIGGYDASELRSVGYTFDEIKAGRIAAAVLRYSRYTASELRSVGCTVRELISGGYTASEWRLLAINGLQSVRQCLRCQDAGVPVTSILHFWAEHAQGNRDKQHSWNRGEIPLRRTWPKSASLPAPAPHARCWSAQLVQDSHSHHSSGSDQENAHVFDESEVLICS